MPLHPRLHMFPLLVECTANQALNTLCHFAHVCTINFLFVYNSVLGVFEDRISDLALF